MTTGRIPGPYVSDVKQDNSVMKYLRGGDFGGTDVGARRSGMPSDAKSENMGLDHVGSSAGRK